MIGIQAYKEHAVTTQTPGRLVVLLYEGAVKFLRMAIQDIERNDLTAKGEHIGRAMDIIAELDNVLDMNAGGQVSQNLRSLYDFMIRHLTKAHLANDPKGIKEIIKLLEEINDGWKGIVD